MHAADEVRVFGCVWVPERDAAAVAQYVAAYAVASGAAAWIEGELVPNTLDLYDWQRLAACESGGHWHEYRAPYQGGLQFHPSTWAAVGGVGNAADAPIEEQIARARTVLDIQGPGAWPVCSRRIAWR